MRTKTVTDGITTERLVVVSAKTTKEDLQAYADSYACLNAFDSRVMGWEDWNAQQPPLPDDPRYGSAEWYRRQIAISIAAARAAAAAGDVPLAMAEALDVGLLLKEHHAKTWSVTQTGVKRRQQVATWSREGVATLRHEAKQRNDPLRSAVRAYCHRHKAPHTLSAIARALYSTHSTVVKGGREIQISPASLAQQIGRLNEPAIQRKSRRPRG